MPIEREYYDLRKCDCTAPPILIQYSWDSPDHYDGWSECRCQGCHRSWGRWTGNEIKEGESEPVFGSRQVGSVVKRLEEPGE